MKKSLIIILVICLSLTVLTGCGNQKNDTDDSENQIGVTPAPNNSDEGEPATDITNMADTEIFNFDSATNTLYGFQESIFGVFDLVIPAKIDGAEVRIIASNAFDGNGLNSVVLPDTLEKIGSNAFSNNNLIQIELPNSLTTIDTAAFERNKITEVTIPKSITEISIAIFSNNSLTKLTLPDTITAIRRSAFSDNMLSEIVIPPLVKIIESFAFESNLLETVEFNDGLERIDGHAFSLNKLTSITIPASVKSIGLASEGATPPTNYERFPFSYNPQLKSVTMLGSDTAIAPFFLAENNNFRLSYDKDGAGTYTGTQYGQWKKVD
ncbi:MAG: leucine-rich repeat domain-containing protein [Clostridiales bacterium]|nr:leucine-rich repeat domain-containing protein [Clostridiales bacterium]